MLKMIDAQAAVLEQNRASYDAIYSDRRTFLRYPADWIIRFHNIYMRANIPSGRVLDFGCGSGNNARFFEDQGYLVEGTEITEAAIPLCRENGFSNVTIVDPDTTSLPYADNSFDLVLSNQVLYYLGSAERIGRICQEFARVLKPGGAVFFTMIGPRNYYVSDGHAAPIGGDVYELKIEGDHRLSGFHQVFLVTRDEEHLRSLFSVFEPMTIGYFDQSMFGLKSNFHWIFAGRYAGD